MGSHNFKGTARGLFGVDHAQEGNINSSIASPFGPLASHLLLVNIDSNSAVIEQP